MTAPFIIDGKGEGKTDLRLSAKKRRENYLRRAKICGVIIACLLLVLGVYLHNRNDQRRALFRPYLVVIDPGHGGRDPGSSGHGVVEKEVNLDVALQLKERLQSDGVNSYLTRTSDSFADFKESISKANQMGATLYLSIHCNWLNDPSFRGTQTFYHPAGSLHAGSLTEKDYAQIIQHSLISNLGTRDRGLRPDARLFVLRKARMPSVLVELAYLSNADDARQLASGSFRSRAAQALADGVEDALLQIKPAEGKK